MSFSIKKFLKLFITYLVISVVLLVCIFAIPIFKFQSFRSFGECFSSIGVKTWLVYFVLVIACSVILGFSKNKKLSVVATIITAIFALLTIFNGYTVLVSGQWSYSQTNLIEDYLVLDNDKHLSNVDHFPKNGKFSNTEDVEYFYFYDEYKHNSQIYLTASYTEQSFLAEKEDLLSKYKDKEVTTENGKIKICITYFKYEELDITEKYIFISDKDKSIKYYTYVEWFQL